MVAIGGVSCESSSVEFYEKSSQSDDTVHVVCLGMPSAHDLVQDLTSVIPGSNGELVAHAEILFRSSLATESEDQWISFKCAWCVRYGASILGVGSFNDSMSIA